jgi:hypothetical protein
MKAISHLPKKRNKKVKTGMKQAGIEPPFHYLDTVLETLVPELKHSQYIVIGHVFYH